jgi:hypothetical protein
MTFEEKNEILEVHKNMLKEVQTKLIKTASMPSSQDMEPELGLAIRHREQVRKIVYRELLWTLYYMGTFVMVMFLTGLCAMLGVQGDDLVKELQSLFAFGVGTLVMFNCNACYSRFKIAGNLLVEGGKLLKEVDMLCKLTDFTQDPRKAMEDMGEEGMAEMHRTLMKVTYRAMKEGKGVIQIVQDTKPKE